MEKNFIEKAANIIRDNQYLTLGTTDGKLPWVSPLYYAYDDKLDFYWVSPKNSVHTRNLGTTEQVSFVIFDSHAPKWTGIGLYFVAKCIELNEEGEVEYGLGLEFERLKDPIPPTTDFLGDNEYRVYKSTPSKVWITADKVVDGKLIDYRQSLSLQQIQEFVSVPKK